MPPPDRIFRLDLPGYEPAAQQEETTGDVVPFPHGPVATTGEDPGPEHGRSGLVARLRPVLERSVTGWRTVWVGDGVLGMRPRPVADLARQFWTAPKPYIRDAWVLRVPYALYGAPVIVLSAVAHLLLFIVSYPSVLAGAGLLVLFLSLFL